MAVGKGGDGTGAGEGSRAGVDRWCLNGRSLSVGHGRDLGSMRSEWWLRLWECGNRGIPGMYLYVD